MSEGYSRYAPGKERCRRCGRWFTPKTDEKYGPTCARKMAGSHTMPDGTIEIRDAKGNLGTVIV
ncbi:MAG: hypothetical protein OIN66_11645 [Candidatus Methanoperedens sp.]|nr:hypothetical protein [Candidatus Methanoperedens sp.]